MADRRGLVLGARVVGGTVAAGVAALVVLGVALVPLPRSSAEPRTLTVVPAPADQIRVCPGSAMRLGDESGADAGSAFAIGTPDVDGAAVDGDLERARLAGVDPGAGSAAAPEVLRVPPGSASSDRGALVAGAQVQDVDAPDFRGLAAAACGEPSGSVWLVGGATTVGRTTAVLLANPTEVPASVSLAVYGESGPVSGPGMTGIDVPAGGQTVVSLAGFAPGLASPVVHVTARGGRVVATLQQSIVRGLDAVGVETVGAGSDPAPSLVVPGVRIVDTVGTGRASALPDWADVEPVVRIGVPGDEPATVTVRVVPEGDAVGASFEVAVEPGQVSEIPLFAGEQGEGDSNALADGTYSVFLDADVPIVGAVRASTAVDAGTDIESLDLLAAPPSDLAWFAAAPALSESALLVVPDGPDPLLTIANPTDADAEVELVPQDGGAAVPLVVPAGRATSVAVEPGAYLLAGSEGLSVAVGLAGPGMLASFVLSPPRPVAGPVVVHPD